VTDSLHSEYETGRAGERVAGKVAGRIALITGANQGIGFEIARQLGKLGIVVFACARDRQKGLAAVDSLQREGIKAHSLLLDVTDQRTIDAAASEVDRAFGKLDILVNNAGIVAERTPPSECHIENIRKTFETNVFGLFTVTKALLPLIRKSPAGRIVNMSSAVGSLTLISDPEQTSLDNGYLAYGASKAAVNSITISFARELRDTAIKVNSISPGYTATAINNFQGYQTVEEGAIAAVRMATLPEDGPTAGFFDKDGTVPW
jgi:NAD(P)-dependent dehydrogenase (short-subunit alcohol dehydrogenase family)